MAACWHVGDAEVRDGLAEVEGGASGLVEAL